MNKTALIVILLFLPLSLYAREKSPVSNEAFDGVSPGGRGLSMGDTGAAAANDASGIYYNPACLSNTGSSIFSASFEGLRQSELSTDEIFALEYLKERQLQFLALIGEDGSFSYRPLSNYTENITGADGWEKNEVKINAFTVSTVHKSDDSFAIGLNLSYLNGRIAQSKIEKSVPSANISNGNGFSGDFGALYKIADELRLGAGVKNILGFMWWDDFEKEQLPLAVRAGFCFNAGKIFIFTSEWEKKHYRYYNAGPKEIMHFGAEQSLGNIIKIRAGIYGEDLNDEQKIRYTAGFGFKSTKYELSLGGENYKINLIDIYRYTFTLDVPVGIPL